MVGPGCPTCIALFQSDLDCFFAPRFDFSSSKIVRARPDCRSGMRPLQTTVNVSNWKLTWTELFRVGAKDTPTLLRYVLVDCLTLYKNAGITAEGFLSYSTKITSWYIGDTPGCTLSLVQMHLITNCCWWKQFTCLWNCWTSISATSVRWGLTDHQHLLRVATKLT